jgi:hypothetical protein
MAECDCPTGSYHCAVELDPAGRTHRHAAAVAIDTARQASHLLSFDKRLELPGGGFTTPPARVITRTSLARFGSVDAEQTDFRLANPQRIAIDDLGCAGDWRAAGPRTEEGGQGEEW